MQDLDSTLTSPLSPLGHGSAALLCATIVWHPDRSRIGEQSIAIGAVLELSRYAPLFQGPGREPAGLGYNGVSRDCVRIVRDGADGLTVQPPASSRMALELNGAELHAPAQLTRRQVEEGAVLGLGRAVLICLHWMRGLPRANPVPGFLGVGAAAVAARDAIRQAAASDVPVLLTGETGSGKEVVARAVHALSRRSSGPFVPVNMAVLSESLAPADLFGAAKGAYTGAQNTRRGLFAEAGDGTLFLDEIGNAPASVQPMLLRVLESGDYRPLGAAADARAGARVIAATDQDIYGGAFNQALLRRLEGFAIELPPLRRRREDLGVLLLEMLGPGGAEVALPFALVSRLANHGWPGNVRQLRNVAQRCVAALRSGAEIDVDALLGRGAPSAPPPVMAEAPIGIAPASQTVRRKPSELAEEQVLAALDNNGWCIQDAANELGISRPSMYKLLEACPQVRRAEQIPPEEVRAALARTRGDLQACARALRTPSEALRRRVRLLEPPP